MNSGLVLVNGAVALNPANQVHASAAVRLAGAAPKYVSRGGHKLAFALERFKVDVTGLRCIDVGASTGGFSDCLLQEGAAHVVAVDVGRGLLHERISSSPDIEVLDRVNIRWLTPQQVGGPVDLVCVDVSFIGLGDVMPSLARLSRPGGELLLLVKPQFEASRRESDRSAGVIRDPNIWRRALEKVACSASQAHLTPSGVAPCPVLGAQGNQEFFLHALRGITGEPGLGQSPSPSGVAASADDVVDAAGFGVPDESLSDAFSEEIRVAVAEAIAP